MYSSFLLIEFLFFFIDSYFSMSYHSIRIPNHLMIVFWFGVFGLRSTALLNLNQHRLPPPIPLPCIIVCL